MHEKEVSNRYQPSKVDIEYTLYIYIYIYIYIYSKYNINLPALMQICMPVVLPRSNAK